jgi:hypothetical protein
VKRSLYVSLAERLGRTVSLCVAGHEVTGTLLSISTDELVIDGVGVEFRIDIHKIDGVDA